MGSPCDLGTVTEETMIRSNKQQNTPKPRREWSFKERLPMAILAAIAPIWTVFFGVFEIYASNLTEFDFTFGDFAGYLLLLALGGIGVLCALLLPLRRRGFDIAFGIIFGITLIGYAQGNFLNFGISSLTGDGAELSIHPAWLWGNAILWLAVIGGSVAAMLLLRRRDWLRTGAILALVMIIGMQLVSFVVLSLTTDVYKSKAELEATTEQTVDDKTHVLTEKNLFTVGKKNNVLLIVIDRFDAKFYDEVAAADPDYFHQFEDFTYYEDNISTYSRTYPAITSMLTGVTNEFGPHDNAEDYFEAAYATSPLFKELKAADYTINLYTDDYYTYRDATVFDGIAANVSGIQNYEIEHPWYLTFRMLELSAYRYVPVMAKPHLSVSTDLFERYVAYETEYPPYEQEDSVLYDRIVRDGLVVSEDDNFFTLLHLWGPHSPYRIDENGDMPEEGTNRGATIGCMNLVLEYINELKEKGLYDDTTIVITGDHAMPLSDYKAPSSPRLTALFVKRAGDKGAFRTSSAQVSQENLIPSLLEASGIDPDRDFGESYWEIPEGETRVRTHYFPLNSDIKGDETLVIFEIKGDGHDFANWRVKEERSLNGRLYR